MPEELSAFQVQLLLYYGEAKPPKRTVTEAARYLGVNKWTVTRALDGLERLGLAERLENRKTALTVPGKRLAEEYGRRMKTLRQYMQYQDIPPDQMEYNALRALTAGFTDTFLDRLAEQEGRMRLKETFAGRKNFSGQEVCAFLEDGSYEFPFIIYREQIQDHRNISMANQGFEHPCRLLVKERRGQVCLTSRMVSAESAASGRPMEGRVRGMAYLAQGVFQPAKVEGRYVYFPADALHFLSMGKGRDTLLHGSVCLKMQCSVGDMHMPESTAIFTMFIH